MKQISFFILVSLLVSCNKRPDLSSLKLVLDEKIEIPFNGEIYQAIPMVYDYNLTGDLVVFDRTTDEIQLYNLPEKEIVKKIKIEREGPDGISSTVNTVFLYNNQFHVIGHDAFYNLDLNGSMVKKITYVSLKEKLELNPDKRIDPIRGAWDKTTGEIYLQYAPRNPHDDQFESLSRFIEIVRFDPKTEWGEIIRIPTPEGLIKDGKGYYFDLIPLLSIANNKIVFMWSVFPEVYVYDLKTKNILEITCVPDGFSKIPPFPYKNYTTTSPMYYQKEGTVFTKVSYDPVNERIFRVHLNYLNNQMKGNQKISVISMKGQCLSPETPENSGWAIGNYDGELHIIQRDVPDENALRINKYTFVRQ